jgi:hypothetical protein
MTMLLIRYRVRCYDGWRAVFDADAAVRHAYGALNERVFRGVADADEVLLCLEWDGQERADLFVRSGDLREAMVRAGVADRPDVWILGEGADLPADARCGRRAIKYS